MDDQKAFVFINPNQAKNGVNVSWRFSTHFNTLEDGTLDCYIPAFDIYFSAKEMEIAHKKSKAVMRSFFNHFMLHENKRGLGNLALQLHKLGFKATNDTLTIKRYIDNNAVRAKFSSPTERIPASFSGSKQIIQEEQMDVAV